MKTHNDTTERTDACSKGPNGEHCAHHKYSWRGTCCFCFDIDVKDPEDFEGCRYWKCRCGASEIGHECDDCGASYPGLCTPEAIAQYEREEAKREEEREESKRHRAIQEQAQRAEKRRAEERAKCTCIPYEYAYNLGNCPIHALRY